MASKSEISNLESSASASAYDGSLRRHRGAVKRFFRSANDRRILHIQLHASIDKYITFDTPEEATKALVNLHSPSPFRSLPPSPQTTRLRSFRASLEWKIPAGWKPDTKERS